MRAQWMIGACDRCGKRGRLFTYDSGSLRQEYLCEWCCKHSALPPSPNDGDDSDGESKDEQDGT